MHETLAQEDETARYDERRLGVLVRFSASLRWPMTLIATVMAAIAWAGNCPPSHVLAWFIVTVIVREARAAALLRLAAQTDRPIAGRLRTVAWMTLGLGSAQGASALLMTQINAAYGAMLTMVVVSLSAGAISTTFTVPKAFVAYAAGIFTPPALMWASRGDALSISIALLLVLFMAVQIRFAHQNLQLFEESYRMRLENMTLLRQLSEERRQLAQARDIAVQADLSKSRFLAAASHDLRQPLQSLSLNTGALTRMLVGQESAVVAEEISTGIEALRHMLDALLDISKLDAGALTPTLQAIPLDRLIQGLCKRFRSSAQSKGLALEGACPAGLVAVSDVDLLQRVLSNLLDNAIKFTPSGRIDLRAQALDDHVLLVVEDTGIGIPEADHQRVFEDLVQLGNPQRDRRFGHGLGLGIVRRLADLLALSYAIESSPGKGTRFLLKLPLGDAAAALLPQAAQGHAVMLNRRVLVLDDDAGVRSAYANALQGLGCQVCCTASLAEALAALPGHKPEIALVDYRLADKSNGLQAIARLRVEDPQLPAVIVSADMTEGLREEAARLDVRVLRKPVSEAMLAAVIDETLGRDMPATP